MKYYLAIMIHELSHELGGRCQVRDAHLVLPKSLAQ